MAAEAPREEEVDDLAVAVVASASLLSAMVRRRFVVPLYS